MRATFVTSGLDTGGAEHALLRLLPGLRTHGIDPDVVSLRTVGTVGPRLQALQIPVTALGLPARAPGALPALVTHVRRCRPDLIHGWMYHGNVAATVAAALAARRTPVVWGIRQSLDATRHDRWLTRRTIDLNAWLSSRARLIVYNSGLARAHHAAHGFTDQRAAVVPNGFDTQIFRPDSEARCVVRHELSIDDTAPVVGHVARFHPAKDHGTFLRAAAAIRQSLPDAVFVLVGKDVVAENRELARDIEALGIGACVRLLGPRDDVARLMAAFDVTCMTSCGEAFPNALAESMSCAVPCVSTAVGDAADVLGDTGAVVPVGDDRALAGATLSLLRLAPADLRARGLAARERIVRHFGIEQVSLRYAGLLTSAVGTT